MRRILFMAAGLLAAVLLLFILLRVRMIELGFLFGRAHGLWLIPWFLVAGLLAGGILSGPRRPWAAWLAVALLVAVPLAIESVQQAEIGVGPVGRAVMDRKIDAVERAALLLAKGVFGGGDALQAEAGYAPSGSCRAVLVTVAGGDRRVWYWYRDGQIVTSLDAARLERELAPLFPAGLRVTGLERGENLWYIRFGYTEQGAPREGVLRLHEGGCLLEIASVGLAGERAMELYLPLTVGQQNEGRLALAQRRMRARAAALAAHGQRVEGVAFGNDWQGRCEAVLVRLYHGAGQTWYWYDDRAGQVRGSVSLDRVKALLTPHLPAGAEITQVEKGDPYGERLSFTFRERGREFWGIALFASDQCRFAIHRLDPGGAAPVDIPLLQ